MKPSYGKVWRQAKTMLVLALPPIAFFLMYPFFLKSLPEIPKETTLPPAVAEAAPGQHKEPVFSKYLVQPGDNLSVIAAKHHIDVATLLAANEGVGEIIRPGQELLILPQKGVLHTVLPGDTLFKIAELYTVKAEAILHANNKNSEFLAAGERLFIPGGKVAQRFESEVSRAKTSRIVWPTVGEISSPFGYRWGRMHNGIDIANDAGTSIRAVLPGHVIYAGWISGYGKTVMIEHGKGYVTLYGHLSEFSVKDGQAVPAGQVIASMGSTGNSTGPHLHFEVQVDGQPVNPLSILP